MDAAKIEEMRKSLELGEPMLKFFAFLHLPGALRAVSMKLCLCATDITLTLPRNAERTVALRKLLEAKDAAVRSAL